MATLTVTDEQLRLIQYALDLYARVGIGQFNAIKDHPTFERHLNNEFKDEEGNTDYNKYHHVRMTVDDLMAIARNLLYNDLQYATRGSWGIGHDNVDNSCRDAFDLVQVIRHEFWKADPNRSSITVDSSVHLMDKSNSNINVEL